VAATRTGPPTPPPAGRPHPGTPAVATSRTAAAPARTPRTADALAALTAEADAEGLVGVDLRALAAELDLTTVATRALLVALVEDGAVHEVGRRVYALAGSPAVAFAATADPAPLPGPRTPPHDAVHEGTGSPLLW
jgi:hypothetical protein